MSNPQEIAKRGETTVALQFQEIGWGTNVDKSGSDGTPSNLPESCDNSEAQLAGAGRGLGKLHLVGSRRAIRWVREAQSWIEESKVAKSMPVRMAVATINWSAGSR